MREMLSKSILAIIVGIIFAMYLVVIIAGPLVSEIESIFEEHNVSQKWRGLLKLASPNIDLSRIFIIGIITMLLGFLGAFFYAFSKGSIPE